MYSNTRKATGTHNEMSNEGFTKEGAANRRDLKLQQNERKGLITLRQAREYAGLSVKKAAEKLGIAESTLRKYEKHAGKIRLNVCNACVKLYKVPGDLIYWGPEEEFVNKQQASPLLLLDEILEAMLAAGKKANLNLWWRLVLPVLNPRVVERMAWLFEEYIAENPVAGPIMSLKEALDTERQRMKEGVRRG